jgi:hypothetical protein
MVPSINIPDKDRYGRLQLQPDNKNGILQTHFQFELRKLTHVTYFCQRINMPGLSLTPVQQPTVFNNINRAGGALVPENLSVNFMVDEDLKNWLEIYNWLQECSNERDFTKYKSPQEHMVSDGTLLILESNNQPRFRITFNELFPVSLTGLVFQTGQQASVYQYSTATFAYTTFNINSL